MKKLIAIAALLCAGAVSADDKVAVRDIHVVTAPGGFAVQGIAHNNTDAVIKNMFVNFKLYDEQGNVIGNTLANGQDIGPGENFKFSALTPVRFAEARLSGVDTY